MKVGNQLRHLLVADVWQEAQKLPLGSSLFTLLAFLDLATAEINQVYQVFQIVFLYSKRPYAKGDRLF